MITEKMTRQMLLCEKEDKIIDRLQQKYYELKQEVIYQCLTLEDFYELKTLKSMITQIDQQNQDKINGVDAQMEKMQKKWSDQIKYIKKQALCMKQKLQRQQIKGSDTISHQIEEIHLKLKQVRNDHDQKICTIQSQTNQKSSEIIRSLTQQNRSIISTQNRLRNKLRSIKLKFNKSMRQQENRRQKVYNDLLERVGKVMEVVQIQSDNSYENEQVNE